jgi:DNA adenine methylase
MRYPGSKARYVKAISVYVAKNSGGRTEYLEPFLGGANSFSVIAPTFPVARAGEFNEDLALMWQAVSRGWTPPVDGISEAEYQNLRHSEPSALRGYAGTGCSFGGKWFGGYARGGVQSSGEPRNHQAESSRAIAKQAPALHNAEVRHCSYTEWNPSANTVVYCDPPYAGTLKYRDDFDHELFWTTARSWSESGALVLVSEQSAPVDWTPVLTFGRRNSTALADARTVTQEHLYRLD